MSDCTNLEMSDLLPELARGALTGPSRLAVEDHLATCEACRAELELVRSAHAVLSTTPAVDTSRIVAAVARSNAVRRDATVAVAQARRRRAWNVSAPSKRMWLAAASIVAAVGVSVIGSNVTRRPDAPAVAPTVAQVEQPNTPAPATPASTQPATSRPAGRAELVMGGGVSDLADADLESLLKVLDDVDTELDVEPAVLLPVLEGDV
jgi:anti-sigma factor RsiW